MLRLTHNGGEILGVESLFDHVGFLIHGLVELQGDDLGAGVEAFHCCFLLVNFG